MHCLDCSNEHKDIIQKKIGAPREKAPIYAIQCQIHPKRFYNMYYKKSRIPDHTAPRPHEEE